MGAPSAVAGMRLALGRAPARARTRRSIPRAAPDHFGPRHLALRLILRTGLPHVQAVARRHRRVRPCRERGFDGDRAWSSVSTKPTPLLDHAHDDGFLTAAQCAAMLPRLEAVIDQLRPEDSNPVLLRRVDDTRQLVTVMQYCLDKDRTQPSSPCPRRRKTASARTTGLPCPWHGASVSGTTAPSRRSWGAAGMGRREPTGTKSVHARTLAWSRPRRVRFPSHPWPPHGCG